MSKLNNKSIFLGLKILSILAFSLLIIPFNSALAEGGRNYTYYNDYSYNCDEPIKHYFNEVEAYFGESIPNFIYEKIY